MTQLSDEANNQFLKTATQMAREHIIEYAVLMDEDFITNWHVELLTDRLEQIEKGTLRNLIVTMPPRHGKLCGDSVNVLTSTGWKTHGELKVGDYVFHPSGKQVEVIAESEKDFASLEVTFSNGEKIKVHKKHEWTVYDRASAKWRTIETQDILNAKYYSGGRSRFQLPNISALEHTSKELPLDPYFFGAWLGDGTSTKPAITSELKDKELINNIKYNVNKTFVHKTTGAPTYYFSWQGIIEKIRGLGCYNNKHIPEIYKCSSIEQRLQLLAGIIDTDGSIDKNSRIRIVTVSKQLAYDISEVITSLGMRPYIMEQKPTKSTSGIQGKKIVYSVGFQPTMEIPVALSRKRVKRMPKQNMIGIVKIEEVEQERGKCIQVDSEDGMYLVGKTLIPTHNSYIINELFPAWYLSRNPKKNIITAANTLRLAGSFTTKAFRHFTSDMSQSLFGIKINRKKRSSTHWETLDGGSHKAFGIQAGIVGSGANVLIVDDPLRNAEQANSKIIRDKVWEEYSMAATSRLTPDGAIIIVTTRYHLDDLVGRVIDNAKFTNTLDDWEIINLPAIAEQDEEFTLSDGRVVGRKAGEALHPERFSVGELTRKKKNMGVANFLTLYQGTPVAAETQIFKKEWFKYVDEKDVKSVEDSQGQRMLRLLAVDAAFSTREAADYTGFTDLRMDRNGNFYIKTWRKKLPPTELVNEILEKQKIFEYDRIFFEGQMYDEGIKAFLSDKAQQENISIPIETISHNRATKELRISAIEPYLRDGTSYFINNWCEDLETELLTYPKGKTDDIVDSLALCISGLKEIRRRASMSNVRANEIRYSI